MQAFVREYAVDHNGAAAARRAGYSEASAREQAYQLLQRTDVQRAVRKREEGVDRLTGSRRHYVLNRLYDLVERSMQAEPVRDGKGKKLGIFKQDGPTAVRAVELLGKHEGMFREQLEVRIQGAVEQMIEGARPLMSPQAYAEFVRALAEVSGVAGVAAPADAGDGDRPVTH
jgi:phage terminase small subunit